jgi:hypothetical protein
MIQDQFHMLLGSTLIAQKLEFDQFVLIFQLPLPQLT